MKLKLSYRMFSKKKASSILLILQFVVALLLLNLMVGNVNFVSFTNYAFAGLAQFPGYFYMPVQMDAVNSKDDQAMQHQLTGIKHISTIGHYWFNSEYGSDTFLTDMMISFTVHTHLKWQRVNGYKIVKISTAYYL